MSYRTDRQRVRGLGVTGDGTHHWWSQRLTAIAMVLLTPFFVFPFVRALGQDWETVRAIYGTPINAIVAILFLLVGFNHLHQGIQVVIEDYVHDKPLRTAAAARQHLHLSGARADRRLRRRQDRLHRLTGAFRWPPTTSPTTASTSWSSAPAAPACAPPSAWPSRG